MAMLSTAFVLLLLAFSAGALYGDTGVYVATNTNIDSANSNYTGDASVNAQAYMIGDAFIIVRGDSSSQQLYSDGLLTQVDVSLAPHQSDRSAVVLLSDGTNATILVKPLNAAIAAESELNIKDCRGYCELRLEEQEVKGHSRAVYKVSAKKKAHILGIIPAHIQTTTNIDAESGEVIDTHKSWWSFLASSDNQAEAYSNSGTSLSSSSGTSASTTGSASGY